MITCKWFVCCEIARVWRNGRGEKLSHEDRNRSCEENMEDWKVGRLADDEAARGEDVLGVEGGFEAEHEGEVRAGRAPNVEGAPRRSIRGTKSVFEFGGAPEERCVGVFFLAEMEDGGGGCSEMREGVRTIRRGQKSEVNDAGGAGDEGVRESRLIGDGAELREEAGEAVREVNDFKNAGGGR